MSDQADDDLFGAEHVRVYRETSGERGYHWRGGTTILLLTTEGRVSGEQRTTPLIHRTDGDDWVIVASKGGAPEHPGWYANLVADPHVMIQDGPAPRDYVVREVEGAERREWWDRSVAAFPTYASYAEKTERLIPVLVASPVQAVSRR